jgi:hypothetical protein
LAVLDRLRLELGEEVAAIVAACSDSFATDPTQKAPWRERKDAYIAHLRDEASVSTLLVCCADKLANARATLRDLSDPAVGSAVWDRFSTGEAGQLWYYASLVEVFEASLPGELCAEFSETVAALRALTGSAKIAVGRLDHPSGRLDRPRPLRDTHWYLSGRGRPMRLAGAADPPRPIFSLTL